MANTVIFNGTEFKSATAVKAQARVSTMDVVVSALKKSLVKATLPKSALMSMA